LTPENCTVGLPPTPEATYVGVNTACVPEPHEGPEVESPPETTALPAVVGTHSHAGDTEEEILLVALSGVNDLAAHA
jgi:hypothetical protein